VQRSQEIPIGYAPAMTRIPAAPQRHIDVLFYGALTGRCGRWRNFYDYDSHNMKTIRLRYGGD